MAHLEVVFRSDDGTYEVHDSQTRQPAVIDGLTLSGLTLETAGVYLYALSVFLDVEVAQKNPQLRYAIERALRASPTSSATHIEDVLVAVRWMMPEIKLSRDIMRAVIAKIAAEHGKILTEE